MLIEQAVVVSYQAGIAQIRFQPKTACGGCVEQKGCGASALSGLTGKKQPYLFQMQSFVPLRAGQYVEVGLPERSLLNSVFWLYIVPLFALLTSTIVSEYLCNTELFRILFIFASTALTLVGVRWYSQILQRRAGYQPVLLRIL